MLSKYSQDFKCYWKQTTNKKPLTWSVCVNHIFRCMYNCQEWLDFKNMIYPIEGSDFFDHQDTCSDQSRRNFYYVATIHKVLTWVSCRIQNVEGICYCILKKCGTWSGKQNTGIWKYRNLAYLDGCSTYLSLHNKPPVTELNWRWPLHIDPSVVYFFTVPWLLAQKLSTLNSNFYTCNYFFVCNRLLYLTC